jgi:superfamily II DNA/RNA helicase
MQQLPERIDKNYFVDMTQQQQVIHTDNAEIVRRIAAKWAKHHFLSEQDQRRLMTSLQYMRMSCDSTYLVDHETDFGSKISELEIFLNEVFERPDVKVVIFSQWIRMQELVTKMLEKNKTGFEFLHGGVASKERGELVRRFRDNPDVRVFLSTDAGQTGLNLQAASVLINLDLPWNPAVLEQRIGRVHRIGQHKPVQVVNFISRGTIEQGMLSVLAFKKSVFAGVLDSGETDVFIGESRFNRFMKDVESVTAAVPSGPAVSDTDSGQANERTMDNISAEKCNQADRQAPQAAALSELLSAGAAALSQIAQSIGSASDGLSLTSLIRKDEKSGKEFLNIPLPDERTVSTIATALAHITDMLKALPIKNSKI